MPLQDAWTALPATITQVPQPTTAHVFTRAAPILPLATMIQPQDVMMAVARQQAAPPSQLVTTTLRHRVTTVHVPSPDVPIQQHATTIQPPVVLMVHVNTFLVRVAPIPQHATTTPLPQLTTVLAPIRVVPTRRRATTTGQQDATMVHVRIRDVWIRPHAISI